MPKFVKKYSNERGREIRNAQRLRNYSKTAVYTPRNWTEDEDLLVLSHPIKDSELSSEIRRSVQSIQARRCKLKKIKNMRGRQNDKQK